MAGSRNPPLLRFRSYGHCRESRPDLLWRVMRKSQLAPSATQWTLERDGYSILLGIFGPKEIERLIDAVSAIDSNAGVCSRGGVYAVRNLLHVSPATKELASSVEVRSIAQENLARDAFPVRGTLFDKTVGANWLVPWHQDLTICV